MCIDPSHRVVGGLPCPTACRCARATPAKQPCAVPSPAPPAGGRAAGEHHQAHAGAAAPHPHQGGEADAAGPVQGGWGVGGGGGACSTSRGQRRQWGAREPPATSSSHVCVCTVVLGISSVQATTRAVRGPTKALQACLALAAGAGAKELTVGVPGAMPAAVAAAPAMMGSGNPGTVCVGRPPCPRSTPPRPAPCCIAACR